MEILRRKDVFNHEAGEFLEIADQVRQPARWHGRGCAPAGFAPGSVVYPYYLVPLAAHFGTQDVTCAVAECSPAAAAEVATTLQETAVAPAPDMGDDWVIAAFPHDAYQCQGWPFPHVHALIVMGTPPDIRRAIRDHEDGMARSW